MCFKTIGKRIIAICLAAAMLSGCTKADNINEKPAGGVDQEDYITEISEDDKYKEWADAVGLLESEHYHVIYFHEDTSSTKESNCLYVQFAGVDRENAEAGIQDIKSLIEAHNRFVETHPDYFPEDMDIRLELVEASQYSYMSFFADYGGKELDEKLGLAFDHKIKYVFYDPNTGTPDYMDADVSFDIPVVIMNYGGWGETNFEDVDKVLDICDGVEAVMTYGFGNEEIDYDEFVRHVHGKAAEAKAYKIRFNEGSYEIEQIAESSFSSEADFTGEWTRTNVHSSQGADIIIENADSEGFNFSGTFSYYYHMGDVAGRAVYTSPSEAEYKQSGEDDIDGEPAYIRFSVDDAGLHVTSEGFVEGLGANVVVDGDYVKGEPAYTNANVMEENFSEKDLEEIKKMLPEETYDYDFKTNSEIGNVTAEDATLADGTKARHIECFVPTAGEGYDMLITEDGRYYFSNLNGGSFATNDTGYSGRELPEYTPSDNG